MTYADWDWRPLGELFDIGAGKTMSSRAREGDDKVPFLRTSNVLWDRIDLSSVDQMTVTPQEQSDKLLRPGDLLVCEGGEIGRAAVWDGQIEMCSFQNHLHRLRPRGSDVDPRFYVYFLQSAFTQLGIFEGAGNKTTIPNLSRNRLAALTVPHPSFVEQRQIVEALSAVRSSVAIHERSAELAAHLKRAALRRVLTHGLRGERQKETDIGPIPESWEMSPIGKFVHQMQYGLSIRGKGVGKYPILRMNCQQDGKVLLRDLQYVDLDQKTADAFRVQPGDILFNRTNSYELVGRSAIVEMETEAVFASYLVRISVNSEELDPRYLNHFLNWDHAQAELKKLASRAVGQANISASKIRGFSIPLPPWDEQREIVAILDTIDRKVDLHKQKRARLHELFSALLYRVMTGGVDAADVDTSALAHVAALAEPAA